MTDPLGQSQVLPYLKGLSRKGYDIHLISYEKSDRFKKHKKFIQHLCDEDSIKWHPQYYAKGKGLKATLKQVRKLRKVADYLHDKHQFSIVHCRSYISALIGLRLKKRGVKFVFDMRGFWADERVDGGLWDLKNPLYRTIYKYFKRKEIQFFREADFTISLTEAGRDEIQSWPALQDKCSDIKIIPCCVNLHIFDKEKIDESERSALKKELRIQPDNFILGYVGSIGTWYMLPEMLDYFKVLKEKNSKARFLFITGEDPEVIQREGAKHGISSDDIIVTSVLHHKVPMCISLFDESIFFIRPTYSKIASSPTKQGEIMAMGVPLVCNSGIGDTGTIVEKYHSGLVIDAFNDEVYTEIVTRERNFDPEAIAAGAEDYFSLEKGVERYAEVYEIIMNCK